MDEKEVHKITLIKKKGKVIGPSPVYDYIYWSPELENLCLYDWIQHYRRKKFKKPKTENSSAAKSDEILDENYNLSFETVTEIDESPGAKTQNVFHFTSDHPLHDSHASHLISNYQKRVPNFIGANLPRCDQGDREYYCCTMLTLFKPWRRGHDLKNSAKASWDEIFSEYEFETQQLQSMKHFNICYECLDARDDYRAQLKKGVDKSLIGSWEVFQDEDGHEIENFHSDTHNDIVYDDVPVDARTHGKNFLLRMKNMNMIKIILTENGWVNVKTPSESQVCNIFKPDRVLSSHEWEADVKKMKQKIIDKQNENNAHASENNTEPPVLW